MASPAARTATDTPSAPGPSDAPGIAAGARARILPGALLNLEHLAMFDRVVEAGSVSAAATALNLQQPTLSRRIAQLEAELGQRLLERNGRGVVATEAGRLLQARARELIALARRTRDELDDRGTSPGGRVVVGLPPRLAQVLATGLIRRFRRTFPRAVITVSEALSVSLRESLVAGRIDLALLYDPPTSPLLNLETLHRERLVLVGPARKRALPDRVALSTLPRYPLILPSAPNAIRTLLDASIGARGIALDVVAEVNAVRTVLALVRDGVGCTILPVGALGIAGSRDGLATAGIGPPVIRNRLVLAEARARPATRLLRQTADLLRQLAATAARADDA
ncbi:MAG: LysR family transcriptional regulator [Lautropia sp.]